MGDAAAAMTLPRVLSFPPRHPYVDRLHGTAATIVHRDEPWPQLPNYYDPAWIHAHAVDWDVAHLHFTFEQYSPSQIEAVLDALRATATPIVWTVHDIENPHLGTVDSTTMRLLAASADRLITLTRGAAADIRWRLERDAQVIPHGPLTAARERQRTRTGSTRRLLLLAKSLRANLDVRTPVDVVSRRWLAGDISVMLELYLHQDVPYSRLVEEGLDTGLLDSGRPLRRVDWADLVSDAAGNVGRRRLLDRRLPGIRVDVGARMSDDALEERLVASDGLLLPYRWGTHSGLIELATDLGVPVIASDAGYLGEQAPCLVVPRRGDDGRLVAADLERALDRQPPAPVPASERAEQLDRFIREHAQLYAALTLTRAPRGAAGTAST